MRAGMVLGTKVEAWHWAVGLLSNPPQPWLPGGGCPVPGSVQAEAGKWEEGNSDHTIPFDARIFRVRFLFRWPVHNFKKMRQNVFGKLFSAFCTLLPVVWVLDQEKWPHLGACYTGSISSPSRDLAKQNLTFDKILDNSYALCSLRSTGLYKQKSRSCPLPGRSLWGLHIIPLLSLSTFLSVLCN